MRLAHDITEVGINLVREFPQHIACRESRGIGDVQGINGLSTTAQRACQNRFPGPTNVGITIIHWPVHVEFMVVVRAGELVQLGHQVIRNVSKELSTRVCPESVQHAVIASDINHFHAVGIGVDKCEVVVKRVEKAWRTYKLQARMYQIAQHAGSYTVEVARTLVDCRAADILQTGLAFAIRITAIGVDIKNRLLHCIQASQTPHRRV